LLPAAALRAIPSDPTYPRLAPSIVASTPICIIGFSEDEIVPERLNYISMFEFSNRLYSKLVNSITLIKGYSDNGVPLSTSTVLVTTIFPLEVLREQVKLPVMVF